MFLTQGEGLAKRREMSRARIDSSVSQNENISETSETAMLPHDADLSARPRALALAPKTYVVRLTRVRQSGGADPHRTLYFRFEGFTRKASRAQCSFIEPERVPPFDGEEGWFEVEQVKARPWPFWRALRQVEAPGRGKTQPL